MRNLAQLQKFFELYRYGRNCALDVQTETGEVLCQFSRSPTGSGEGLGTPGAPYSNLWVRVADCLAGDITEPKP